MASWASLLVRDVTERVWRSGCDFTGIEAVSFLADVSEKVGELPDFLPYRIEVVSEARDAVDIVVIDPADLVESFVELAHFLMIGYGF